MSSGTQGKPHGELAGVRAGYDRWASLYDRDGNPLPPLEEPLVAAALGEVRGLSVLDLGCGTGRHSFRLAAAGAAVTALDFSEGMLAQARLHPDAATVSFQVHDLHQPLPFPGGTFDRVVSGLVLEHLAELRPFFQEAHRVLRPGGRAVVSAMHPAMFLRDARARFSDPETGAAVYPGSRAHPLGEMVLAALHAGFQINDITEAAPDAAFAARWPRAERYVEWPMVVVFSLEKGDNV